jgi:hypothetical protein
MAGLSLAALMRLLPIQSGPQMRQALDGVGISLDRAHEFLRAVQDNARPITASEDTIDLWLQALGITMPASSTLGEKRAAADAAYSAKGGQSIGYIRSIFNKRFPNVSITETDTFEFTLGGFYPYSRDFVYLLALVQRITPAHLEAVYNVRPVYDGDVARCRWGVVGRAICGRGSTAYVSTEGTIARCGVGRVNLTIVGRTAVV